MITKRVWRAVLGLAMAIAPGVSGVACAQTRAELVNFLFRDGADTIEFSKSLTHNAMIPGLRTAVVEEVGCVVTIRAKKQPSDPCQYSDAVIRIDLNKMVARTLITTKNKFGSLEASIAGQAGFVSLTFEGTTRTDTGRPTSYDWESFNISSPNHDIATGLKYPVVLQHFIANHCRGTNSVL